MKGRFTRPRCYREWHRSAVGYTVTVLMEVNMALVLIACVITGTVLGHRVAVSLGVAS